MLPDVGVYDFVFSRRGAMLRTVAGLIETALSLTALVGCGFIAGSFLWIGQVLSRVTADNVLHIRFCGGDTGVDCP